MRYKSVIIWNGVDNVLDSFSQFSCTIYLNLPFIHCTCGRRGSLSYIFARLEHVSCFPAIGTGRMFYRTWIFARFWSVVRFYFDVIRAKLAVNLG